jgi:hypothetical protein
MHLRQQKTHTVSKITSGLFLTTAISMLIALPVSSSSSPVLWNTLGSSSEVLNSAFGPNLSFYAGGDPFGIVGTPAYVPGVFGNGLSIGPGSYSAGLREHTVVWNNVNNYLNADRGTISIWYKQNTDPVAFSYGVYRLFDGSYGLGSGIGLSTDADNNALNFSVNFGGNQSLVSYNVSAYNGTWIHVGGVWDRTGIDGSLDKLRLYINGAVVGTSQWVLGDCGWNSGRYWRRERQQHRRQVRDRQPPGVQHCRDRFLRPLRRGHSRASNGIFRRTCCARGNAVASTPLIPALSLDVRMC